MGAPKKISVGPFQFQFSQRARGEETRYWLGLVFKDGKMVGEFKNDGRGGKTLIHECGPNALSKLEEKLEAFVDETNPEAKTLFERADVVIHYAEYLGYERGQKLSWPEFLKVWIEEMNRAA